jgi:hypothetical protein
MEQDQEGGEDRERVEVCGDREWEAAEAVEEWATGPGLDQGEDVSARLVALPLHIRPVFPALITNARNAEQP